MLYLGNLYGHYRPDFFFEAVSHWLQRRPESAKNTVIHFIGTSLNYRQNVEDPALKQILRFTRRVPHHTALPKLCGADLLLLIVGFDKSFGGIIPAKFFEYVATRRPILAFVPPGEAERLVVKYQVGIAITTPDIQKTCEFLDAQYDKWKASSCTAEPSALSLPPELDRRNHAQKLANIFASLC